VATSRASNATSTPGPAKTINTVVVIIMLLLAVIVQITGWNDLATYTLCLTQIVSADAFIGLGLLTGATFSNAIAVMALVFLMKKWIGATPQINTMNEKGYVGNTRSPTIREIRRISGPFLPEARDYSK